MKKMMQNDEKNATLSNLEHDRAVIVDQGHNNVRESSLTSKRLISFFFKALFAAASVARRMSEAASRNFCCSFASLGFLAAP